MIKCYNKLTMDFGQNEPKSRIFSSPKLSLVVVLLKRQERHCSSKSVKKLHLDLDRRLNPPLNSVAALAIYSC